MRGAVQKCIAFQWEDLRKVGCDAGDWINIAQDSVHCMGGLPGELSEEHVTQEKQKKAWRMSCDVGEATEWLNNEL